MKLLKKIRKGFTLIELVVVIAVIAILAAVSVVSYVSITNKAKQSNDQQKIDQTNLSLQALEVRSGKPKTMYEAVKGVEEDGFKPENFKAEAKDYTFAYAMEENRFVILKNDQVVYPSDMKSAEGGANIWLFEDAVGDFSSSAHSHYFRGEGLSGTVKSSAGVDVGENSGISKITYATAASQDVVIRTNSSFTTLTVAAPNSEVSHYGNANVINITAVKFGTYEEKGSVGTIFVKAGKVEVTKDAYVGTIAVDKDATNNNGSSATDVAVVTSGTVFATELVEYNAETLEHDALTQEEVDALPASNPAKSLVEEVETVDVASSTLKVGSADALINLAASHAQNAFSGAVSIELTANIDLTGKTWVPFGAQMTSGTNPFEGTIDGKNHKIIGLSNGSYESQALSTQNGTTKISGYIYGFVAIVKTGGSATVKNIIFDKVDIDAPNCKSCGVVFGCDSTYQPKSISISNIQVNGSIKTKDKAGGLIGYAVNTDQVTISGCSVDAEIKVGASGYRAGGLIGYVGGNNNKITSVKVENSSFAGSVESEGYSSGAKNVGALFSGASGITNGEGSDSKIKIEVTGFTTSASISCVYEGKAINNFPLGAIANTSGSILGIIEDYSHYRLGGVLVSSITTSVTSTFTLTKCIVPNA